MSAILGTGSICTQEWYIKADQPLRILLKLTPILCLLRSMLKQLWLCDCVNGGFLENLTFKEISLADLVNKKWNGRVCINENINLHISGRKLPLSPSSLWSPHQLLWTPGFSSWSLGVPSNHNLLDRILHCTCSGPTISSFIIIIIHCIVIIIIIFIIVVIRGGHILQTSICSSSAGSFIPTEATVHYIRFSIALHFDWEISSLSWCSAKWITINIML